MIVHALRDPPPPHLADALAAFEAQFVYPLGPGRSFRISHGVDYPRFFRAMGDARSFVAEKDGRVLGTLGVSLRNLILPDGKTQRAAYIGDLKIAPTARGGLVLYRLAREAYAWAKPQVSCAFGVVMDGTAALPHEYTGRAGVTAFAKRGAISIRRFPADLAASDDCVTPSPSEGESQFNLLAHGAIFASGGEPALRSNITPQWIASPDGLAIGRLEDTRQAKWLLLNDGTELSSAHLACFAWQDPSAAAVVINAARSRAAALALPGVFVSIDSADALALDAAMADVPESGMSVPRVPPMNSAAKRHGHGRDARVTSNIPRMHNALDASSATIAGATVYGVNVPADSRWIISSSEV